MSLKRLHIVCFDIPYPATYGGAIDVYYRIQALYEAGVQVTLHCTYKGALVHHPELEKLCRNVYYYPRKTGIKSLMGLLGCEPLTVYSRPNREILVHLTEDEAPILYEGLVSCGTMSAPQLHNRKKYFRECNVEHDYYHALAKATASLWEKCYFHLEARRLKRFESTLNAAQGIFALAHQDEAHFKSEFPHIATYYVPCFHSNTSVSSPIGMGKGILYHGNLNVAENRKAAEYIIRNIAPQLPDIPFIIAGRNDGHGFATFSSNIQCVFNPNDTQMKALVEQAQVHLLVTFQATGLKLKLLNALYQGRHVICNTDMVCGTELANLCHVAHTGKQLALLCQECYSQPFSIQEKEQRTDQLQSFHNAQLIQTLLHDMGFSPMQQHQSSIV